MKKPKAISDIMHSEEFKEETTTEEVDFSNVTKYVSEAKAALEANGYSNYNEELFSALAAKIAEFKRGKVKKGLFLCGKNGVGKTMGMEMMIQLTKRFLEVDVVMVNALAVQKNYLDNKISISDQAQLSADVYVLEVFNYRKRYPDMIIDDIGSERTVNDYGNKFELISDLIMYRYEWARKHRCLTHFTTNLMPDEIKARYGERIWSRVNEMCEVVFCEGKDFRFITEEE